MRWTFVAVMLVVASCGGSTLAEPSDERDPNAIASTSASTEVLPADEPVEEPASEETIVAPLLLSPEQFGVTETASSYQQTGAMFSNSRYENCGSQQSFAVLLGTFTEQAEVSDADGYVVQSIGSTGAIGEESVEDVADRAILEVASDRCFFQDEKEWLSSAVPADIDSGRTVAGTRQLVVLTSRDSDLSVGQAFFSLDDGFIVSVVIVDTAEPVTYERLEPLIVATVSNVPALRERIEGCLATYPLYPGRLDDLTDEVYANSPAANGLCLESVRYVNERLLQLAAAARATEETD